MGSKVGLDCDDVMREVSHSKFDWGPGKEVLGTPHLPHNARVQSGGVLGQVSPQQSLTDAVSTACTWPTLPRFRRVRDSVPGCGNDPACGILL